MRKIWHDKAWDDYIAWQIQDKNALKKINRLLQDIDRHGYDCTGKPEPLMFFSPSTHIWRYFICLKLRVA